MASVVRRANPRTGGVDLERGAWWISEYLCAKLSRRCSIGDADSSVPVRPPPAIPPPPMISRGHPTASPAAQTPRPITPKEGARTETQTSFFHTNDLLGLLDLDRGCDRVRCEARRHFFESTHGINRTASDDNKQT